MYFINFPKTYYSLDDRASVNIITDILRRIVIDEKVLNNTVLFDEYDVKEGEDLEIISDRFYNDPSLYWLIALCNDIFDPRFDLPLGYNEFEKYIKGKYSSNLYLTTSVANAFYLNEVITGSESGATAKVSANTYAASTLQYIKLEGAFEASETITGYLSNSIATVTSSNPHYYDTRYNVKQYELGNNIVVTQTTYNASSDTKKREVTNYLYEQELNESKRRIKILKPQYVSLIVEEFNRLVNR